MIAENRRIHKNFTQLTQRN